MKFECPKCKAVSNVEESKIPDKGIYGRCPKCQARFLVRKDVGFQKTPPERDKKPDKMEEEKREFEKNKLDESTDLGTEERSITGNRKVSSFGSILFYGGIFLLIAIPVFYALFNSFVQKREYERSQETRKKEIKQNIDIFTSNPEKILTDVETMIDQGKLALAEKEINKFDIPVLREFYPEIDSLKERIYAEKIRNEHGTKANSIYKLTYDYAYKAGVAAGRYDKNNGYPYSPEDTLNLSAIQTMLNKVKEMVKESAGYLYEDAAELGFNDGYIDGYKESYYRR